MTTSARGPSSNLTIFGLLLAIAVLVHKTQVSEELAEPVGFLTTVLAIAVVFRPNSVRVLLAFTAAMLVEATWYSPFFFLAHMIYAIFACIAVLGVAASIAARSRRLPISLSEMEPHLFPLCRAGLYAMFGLVVLHKLNAGFFDQTISCAVEHYQSLRGRVPLVPDAGQLGGLPIPALVTIVTEGSIPILLFFRATRQLGIIVALGFHYAMAVNGFQGFSGFAMPMYLPFLPREFYVDVQDFLGRAPRRLMDLIARGVPIGFAALGVLVTMSSALDRAYQIKRLGFVFFIAAAPVIGLFYLWLVFRPGGPRRPWPQGRATAAWQIAVLVVFVAQGLSPYFGLKTEAVFSIFSNLQTEEGRWNHLFLPESLRIFDFQQSPVTVTAVGGMTQLRAWERDYLPGRVPDVEVFTVTRFELKRQIAAHCRAGQGPITLSYIADGKKVDLADACQDPELSAGNPWLLEKLLWFRVVHDSGNRCLH